jgi:hypothetical protein
MRSGITSRWKWAALPAAAMALLALYPQINLWLGRGSTWQGSYVLVQGDEDAYSAYINALIDGRPRRNDPHTGRDDSPGAPQPESLFSIQFVPSYAIALPARALHLSASTIFIVLIALAAIASALAIFWLVHSVTGDQRIAAGGVIFVLCLGTLVATQGGIRVFLGTAPTYSFFPFLRRYQPAFPFPLFFVFCGFIWQALKARTTRSTIVWAAGGGTLITVLIFSYFYLWTAALAWLAGCALLWLILIPEGRGRMLLVCGLVFAFALLGLVPYSILLSHRDPNMDKVQLLTLTHAPDLFRVPELIGFVAIVTLLFGLRRRVIEIGPTTLFVVSLGLMPLIVFNQQVFTGRSLQPLHYELFIANYVSLLGLLMAIAVVVRNPPEKWRMIQGRAIALVTLLAFGWGIIEATGATRRDVKLAQIREDAMPVSKKLIELAKQNGSESFTTTARDPRPVVFASTLPVADCLPTMSPQASLWALHMDAFPGATQAERKERFYQYMYYSGISDQELGNAILEGRFAIMVALFGVERVIPGLVPGEQPVTTDEMRREWLLYSQYIAGFSRERAAKLTLSYVVVPTEAMPNLSNLDRWYERGTGVQAGLFTIYPVKLRP